MSRKSAVRSLYRQARKEALFRLVWREFAGDSEYLHVFDGSDPDGYWEVQDPPGSGKWRPLITQ